MRGHASTGYSILVACCLLGSNVLITEARAAKGFGKKLLQLHNEEREKRNKPRMRAHGALRQAARKYAMEMDGNGNFSHTGLNGRNWDDRIRAQGYFGSITGENLAYGYLTARATFRAWMRSTGHRRNIRRSSFDRVGFGKSGLYWVANFGG